MRSNEVARGIWRDRCFFREIAGTSIAGTLLDLLELVAQRCHNAKEWERGISMRGDMHTNCDLFALKSRIVVLRMQPVGPP